MSKNRDVALSHDFSKKKKKKGNTRGSWTCMGRSRERNGKRTYKKENRVLSVTSLKK